MTQPEKSSSRERRKRASIEDCFYDGNHPTCFRLPCSPLGVITGCRECDCGRYGAHVKGCTR